MFTARLLLLETDLNVYAIADKIGYSDAGHSEGRGKKEEGRRFYVAVCTQQAERAARPKLLVLLP
ncbi:helix-turn-helix transcriptional regulator [Mastigocoleus testarum]|uniref:Uncharacterized protein n=1 Tax=Mastigocoleus testarum BC008 TaxID=371196 RepID=A0A0V8A025_9CYAN|nr:hypothetical protein [Mastigocoleus testarum]KST70083.1 hypothetical protein BC008_06505 [Mastigocoleus testarum BC008]KST70114.1 hypothetical protein BC008_06675 [Mastigocoleus testarum BC008]